VLTLAIAAGTVTFSIVDTIALRRLPFPNSDRLVAIGRLEPQDTRPRLVAPQELYEWQATAPAFEAVAGISEASLSLKTDGQTENLVAARSTANLFDVLRTWPSLGRAFLVTNEQAGNDSVVIISHRLWVRRFSADPAIIGRIQTFGSGSGGVALQIIGVMPGGFTYPVGATQATDAWIPFVPGVSDRDHRAQGRNFVLETIGRLRDDATLEDARVQVEQAADRIVNQYQSVSWRSGRPVVMSLQDWVVGPAKRWLVLALVAVALVLLVGFVNVVNLLLARVVIRGREFATRAALGASQVRLARTLLFEVILLSAAACAFGVLLSVWGLSAATSFLPSGLARASTIALDLRVLVVSIAATLGIGLCFGALPAWQASRAGLALATRNTSLIGGLSGTRWQRVLLVSQVAFVVTLLVATTLAVTTFVRVTTTDLGFDRRNVVSFTVSNSITDLLDIRRRISAVPGVASVAFIDYGGLPLSGMSTRDGLSIDGFGVTKDDDMAEVRKVSPAYFDVLGMRLVRGRPIQDSDVAGAPHVAVINQAAAKRYFGDADPVGREISSSTDWQFRGSATIVGVVESLRLAGPEGDVRPELYLPMAQQLRRDGKILVDIVVRTADAPEGSVAAIQAAMRAVIGTSARLAPRYPTEQFRQLTAERRFNAGLMTLFGVFGVIVGGLGIYGVMSFVVASQVRVIGLRIALGASPASILRAVLWQTGQYLLIGVAFGLIGARLSTNLLETLVFGLSPSDPLIYVIVVALITAVGFVAALCPSVRAARVDPLVMLRAD
jgi:putative ABC transport system permease protein